MLFINRTIHEQINKIKLVIWGWQIQNKTGFEM